jgi:acetyltransferase-like isoleucine patch superfamily enzyme
MKRMLKFIIRLITFILYPFYTFYNSSILLILEKIRKELLLLKLKNTNTLIDGQCSIGKRVTISVGQKGKLIIGKNVFIADDVYIKVRNNAVLKIGDNVNINTGSRISSFESILIGSNTLIASYCNILDHDHKFNLRSPASTEHYDCLPIEIKEGVWLGTKVQVNKGVIIGRFSVIAANAVVTKKVEESCVYGGVPAKKIRCLEK